MVFRKAMRRIVSKLHRDKSKPPKASNGKIKAKEDPLLPPPPPSPPSPPSPGHRPGANVYTPAAAATPPVQLTPPTFPYELSSDYHPTDEDDVPIIATATGEPPYIRDFDEGTSRRDQRPDQPPPPPQRRYAALNVRDANKTLSRITMDTMASSDYDQHSTTQSLGVSPVPSAGKELMANHRSKGDEDQPSPRSCSSTSIDFRRTINEPIVQTTIRPHFRTETHHLHTREIHHHHHHPRIFPVIDCQELPPKVLLRTQEGVTQEATPENVRTRLPTPPVHTHREATDPGREDGSATPLGTRSSGYGTDSYTSSLVGSEGSYSKNDMRDSRFMSRQHEQEDDEEAWQELKRVVSQPHVWKQDVEIERSVSTPILRSGTFGKGNFGSGGG